MGRKSIFPQFVNKTVGGVIILSQHGFNKKDSKRLNVKCKCLACGKNFITAFHHVYRGKYKSCGCLQHAFGKKNPKWDGYGEISRSYFNSLMRGAKSRNLKFNIKIEYIWNLFLKQYRKCAISGEKLRFQLVRNDNSATASLDRIDATKGYVETNLQWVHKDINYMKQSMNNEEFLLIVNKIYKYNNV